MKRILALLLALSMVFCLAACDGNSTGDTTQGSEGTSDNGEALPPAAGEEDSTPVDGSEPADATEPSSEDETQNAAQLPSGGEPITAPVNGSKADIVAFYNKYANATKAYKGKMTIKRVEGTVSKAEEVSPELARSILESKLPNDYPQTKTLTFNNGRAADGTAISNFLPPNSQSTMSTLSADGVKSATCTTSGSGWRVVIVLASEKGNDINFKPKHHATCMDTLNITAESIAPLTLNEAEITYVGATITATFNSDGLLTALNISEPATIKGKLAASVFNLITTTVSGTWKQEMTFTY